jgi:hypothetical protein
MSTELEMLRHFATTTRSRGGFGVTILKCDGNDGKWKAGKDGKDMNGRKLVADVPDVMHGHQKFENKIPVFNIGRASDGFTPSERETLGDTDQDRWSGGKDPWQPVVLQPMFDDETRESFLFISSNQGGRDAVAILTNAFVENSELHPEDAGKLPLCSLASDSYLNTHSKRIHFPIFEIIDWIERPAAVRRIKPPPVVMLAIEQQVQPEPSTESSAPPKAKSKIRSKAGGGGLNALDDEVPFAPSRI